jgi:hypothetical protein
MLLLSLFTPVSDPIGLPLRKTYATELIGSIEAPVHCTEPKKQ